MVGVPFIRRETKPNNAEIGLRIILSSVFVAYRVFGNMDDARKRDIGFGDVMTAAGAKIVVALRAIG